MGSIDKKLTDRPVEKTGTTRVTRDSSLVQCPVCRESLTKDDEDLQKKLEALREAVRGVITLFAYQGWRTDLETGSRGLDQAQAKAWLALLKEMGA